MNSIKEKMHGTNNIPDLNALKIELENVKLEPVSSVFWTTIQFFFTLIQCML